MDKSEIFKSLEQAVIDAQELGADTRHMEALLEELRSNWDRMEELMAK